MEEIWLPVVEYEGLYLISNQGKVKAAAKFIENKGRAGSYTSKEKLMKLSISNKGYSKITLTKQGKSKFISVHRMVASAFIFNEHQKPSVNHIDGNKLNNFVENLEWCTHTENIKHAVLTGLHNSPKHDALVLNLENGLFYQHLKDFREAMGRNKERLNEMMRAGKLKQYLKIPYESL